MSNDELAEAFRLLFVDLHAKVSGMPDGHAKTSAARHLRVFHAAGDDFHKAMVTHDEVQPFDGTNKPT